MERMESRRLLVAELEPVADLQTGLFGSETPAVSIPIPRPW
jgi:hypothetical protein